MVVKQCGLRCTGSFKRLVRVSSVDERGRRAMVYPLCPVIVPATGVDHAGTHWTKIDTLSAVSRAWPTPLDAAGLVWTVSTPRYGTCTIPGHHLEQLAVDMRRGAD